MTLPTPSTGLHSFMLEFRKLLNTVQELPASSIHESALSFWADGLEQID